VKGEICFHPSSPEIMALQRNVYALILAGGSGTRFWPLSRDRRPKQLLRLFDDETLIEKAVARLEGFVPLENVLILTSASQVDGVREVLPGLPASHIVAEPARRDTAPAIALAAGWVAARDPEAVMVALPADQLVRKEEEFRGLLAAASEAASLDDVIVTLGIRPDWPCPGYGYIERGDAADIPGYEAGVTVNEVISFREKPSPDLAEEFLARGNFAWNAGIFIWSIPTLIAELERHCPELAAFIRALRDSDDFDGLVGEQFPRLTRISIDFALMEKASRVLNIEADIGWDDVGGWLSVAKYLEKDDAGNAHNGAVVASGSSGNIVFSEGDEAPLVALLGVEDLIVVRTADAILVAHRDEADRIKALVGELPPELT